MQNTKIIPWEQLSWTQRAMLPPSFFTQDTFENAFNELYTLHSRIFVSYEIEQDDIKSGDDKKKAKAISVYYLIAIAGERIQYITTPRDSMYGKGVAMLSNPNWGQKDVFQNNKHIPTEFEKQWPIFWINYYNAYDDYAKAYDARQNTDSPKAILFEKRTALNDYIIQHFAGIPEDNTNKHSKNKYDDPVLNIVFRAISARHRIETENMFISFSDTDPKLVMQYSTVANFLRGRPIIRPTDNIIKYNTITENLAKYINAHIRSDTNVNKQNDIYMGLLEGIRNITLHTKPSFNINDDAVLIRNIPDTISLIKTKITSQNTPTPKDKQLKKIIDTLDLIYRVTESLTNVNRYIRMSESKLVKEQNNHTILQLALFELSTIEPKQTTRIDIVSKNLHEYFKTENLHVNPTTIDHVLLVFFTEPYKRVYNKYFLKTAPNSRGPANARNSSSAVRCDFTNDVMDCAVRADVYDKLFSQASTRP